MRPSTAEQEGSDSARSDSQDMASPSEEKRGIPPSAISKNSYAVPEEALFFLHHAVIAASGGNDGFDGEGVK
ncbi:MAG: hypothetical protein E7Z68_08140 [Thermoplasmata archaeon]|nr:hypothetical protein [Thermoplasmata archaeon]